jgi:hypothetical protein
MIIRNKLDKPFGPFGTSTGFFLLAGGIIATWYSLSGLILAFLGAFIAFTTTSTFIDTDRKRVKFSNDFFGFYHSGKWLDIEPGMKLGLKNAHRGYRAYTRANQPTDIHYKDIRIYLYNSRNKQIGTISKFSSAESANIELEKLRSDLGLENH